MGVGRWVVSQWNWGSGRALGMGSLSMRVMLEAQIRNCCSGLVSINSVG